MEKQLEHYLHKAKHFVLSVYHNKCSMNKSNECFILESKEGSERYHQVSKAAKESSNDFKNVYLV